ncbi:hypothetical protein EI546_08945 [Aequorivita sp. H23M31]|uniref:LysM domain-containing protein n=1 Tax=Aequorivita ciconiae TaxID=2494375 RepID=A0A410G3J0_9FLAO|nr:hypothetical protein [Aequorivita sp. H23M31]QAA81836.1 hypothetical protein EI546_08945 [Aequorivita sp. H23M31]
MFTDKSRYKKVSQYETTDSRGRTVKVVATPAPLQQSIRGFHLLKQGQRPDHLAALYLNDAAAFWRIAEANDCMLPEALTEKSEIAIPNKI